MRIVNMSQKPTPPYIYVGRKVTRPIQSTIQSYASASPDTSIKEIKFELEVTEGSPFGNPFRIGKGIDREEALKSYRKHLWNMLCENDYQHMALMARMDLETSLACWCADLVGPEQILDGPEVCHAQIIWKAWHYLYRNGKLEKLRDWVEKAKRSNPDPAPPVDLNLHL